MSADGLVTIRSAHDAVVTRDKLLSAVLAKSLTIFAVVDHAAGASDAGLSLRPTTLVMFGNPAAGTPLMQAAQTAGIDLPLKILIWQDEKGAVNVGYNDPAWIAARHGLTGDMAVSRTAPLAAALAALARAAAG